MCAFNACGRQYIFSFSSRRQHTRCALVTGVQTCALPILIAVGVALAYGLAGLWAVSKGRRAFDDRLRPLQQRLAIALMLLAAFLALPVLDFGTISTRDQLARLESGAVAAEKFDWAALAFEDRKSTRLNSSH